MAKKRYNNYLTSGVLGNVKQTRPEDPRYPHGCEQADGVIFVGDRMVPAPSLLANLQQYRYRGQQMMPPDPNFYLENTGPTGVLAIEQTTVAPNDISPVTSIDLLSGVLDAAISSGNYAAKVIGNFTLTGLPTTAGVLSAYVGQKIYSIPVAVSESLASIASALAAAINADTSCPVSGVATLGVVACTADPVHQPSGNQYNTISLSFNLNGESFPSGLSGSTVSPDGGYGFWQAALTGPPAIYPQWGGSGGIVPSSTALTNSKTIRYVRAFQFLNPATVRYEWGIVSQKTVNWSDRYQPWYWLYGTETDYGSEPQTLVLGRGSINVSVHSTSGRVHNGSPGDLTANITITPQVFEAPEGILAYAESLGLTVVGKMGMFKGAPSICDYSHQANASPDDPAGGSVTVSTVGQVPSVAGYEDCWVLGYGAPGQSSSGYVDPDLVVPTTGFIGYDYMVQGKNSGFLTTTPTATTTSSFAFSSNRQIVVGSRRIGQAVYFNSGVVPNGTVYGLGATQISNGAGRALPTTGNTASDPWFIMLPDGPPVWYEYSYQGLIVGTQGAEYLIENEQIAPSASSINSLNQYVGIRIHRISSDGCPWKIDNLKSLSCQLDGNIHYINQRGVSTMTFSHEHQSAIPDVVDLVGMGFGLPTSVASSRNKGLVLAFCPKPANNINGGMPVIVAINKTAGCVTTIPAPTIKWSPNPGTVQAQQFTLYGLDTLQAATDTNCQVGEPLFVWVGTVSGVTTYLESQMDQNGIMGFQANIRTSRFGASLGTRTKVLKAYIELINTRGGRMRVALPRNVAATAVQNTWLELPYTQVQYGDPTQTGPGLGVTGVIEEFVVDRVDVKSEGKALELSFNPGEYFELVAIGVDTEETE